jgi:hypothetical protein
MPGILRGLHFPSLHEKQRNAVFGMPPVCTYVHTYILMYVCVCMYSLVAAKQADSTAFEAPSTIGPCSGSVEGLQKISIVSESAPTVLTEFQ